VDSILVSNKSMSQAIPSSCCFPGPGNLGQNGQHFSHLQCYPQTIPKPKTLTIFFIAN